MRPRRGHVAPLRSFDAGARSAVGPAFAVVAAFVVASCTNSATTGPTAGHPGQPATPAATTTPGWLHPRFQGRGDLDGDGQVDRVKIRPHSSSRHGSRYIVPWVLRANLTRLGPQSAVFRADRNPGDGPPLATRLIQILDMDGDGADEVVVQHTHGASTAFWTIFKVSGGKVRQVMADGEPVSLAVGGSVGHLDGFRCARGRLVSYGAGLASDSEHARWLRVRYAWQGATLVRTDSRHGRKTSTGFDAYGRVHCHGLSAIS